MKNDKRKFSKGDKVKVKSNADKIMRELHKRGSANPSWTPRKDVSLGKEGKVIFSSPSDSSVRVEFGNGSSAFYYMEEALTLVSKAQVVEKKKSDKPKAEKKKAVAVKVAKPKAEKKAVKKTTTTKADATPADDGVDATPADDVPVITHDEAVVSEEASAEVEEEATDEQPEA